MNGLYVIVLILVVGIWYTVKIIQHSKLRHTEQTNIYVTYVKSYYYKWFSLIICSAATAILIKDVVITTKLAGAGLAQADFGTFFDFIVYAIPSILFVIICLYHHIKRIAIKPINIMHILTDPFVILSILVASLPIIVFAFS